MTTSATPIPPQANFIQRMTGQQPSQIFGEPRTSFVDSLMGKTTYKAPPIAQTVAAIGQNETGGVKGNRYAFSKPSGSYLGNAMGKYQVTQGTLKSTAQKYLGAPMTSQQFQSSPSEQDKYMDEMARQAFVKGYTPPQVADMHRSGSTHESAPGSTSYQNNAYVARFNKNFKA